jgi:hypothetical protein
MITFLYYCTIHDYKQSNSEHRTTCRIDTLLVVLDADLRLLPLASRDLTFEHDVDLSVGPVLHFGETEVCHDETEESCACPDVTAFTAEVAASRVEHVRCDCSHVSINIV